MSADALAIRGRGLSPEVNRRIIELKLAKTCSVEIREQLDVTGAQIDKIWKAYRRANPGTPDVGTNVHGGRGRRKGGV